MGRVARRGDPLAQRRRQLGEHRERGAGRRVRGRAGDLAAGAAARRRVRDGGVRRAGRVDERPAAVGRVRDRDRRPLDDLDRRVRGQARSTSTPATGPSAATRCAHRAVSTRASGVPSATPAAATDLRGVQPRCPVTATRSHGQQRRGRAAARPARRAGTQGEQPAAAARPQPAAPAVAAARRRGAGLQPRHAPAATGAALHAGGAHRSSSSRRTSGPTCVTSPAPRVSTRSPGRARRDELRPGTADQLRLEHAPARGGSGHGGRDGAAAGARHRVLPRGVDLHDDDLVGQRQRLRRSRRRRRACGCSGAAGRPRRAGRRRRPRGPRSSCALHLGGVVGVVVVDPHAAGHALELHPPAHAGVAGQPLDEQVARAGRGRGR